MRWAELGGACRNRGSVSGAGHGLPACQRSQRHLGAGRDKLAPGLQLATCNHACKRTHGRRRPAREKRTNTAAASRRALPPSPKKTANLLADLGRWRRNSSHHSAVYYFPSAANRPSSLSLSSSSFSFSSSPNNPNPRGPSNQPRQAHIIAESPAPSSIKRNASHANKPHMEQPILNPPNPYVGPLRIFPGTLVKVAGRPVPNATRFAINFQTGPSLNPRDDLALHLSPVFGPPPPRLVRNSLQHGAWGLEEAWGNGSVLTPHQPFEIMVLAEPEQFKVAVNGAHYCEFRHRIPYAEISHLTIDGDVEIHRITITTNPAGASNPVSVPPSAAYHQPSAPTSANLPPYPTAGPAGMPMPGNYPVLPPGGAGPMPYPAAAAGPYAPQGPPPGPVPTGAGYSNYPPATGYPGQQGPYPAQPGPYPAQAGYMPGGPTPSGSQYRQDYPGVAPAQQPPQSSSSGIFGLPVGNKALGTVAGLGLGAAAGAAVLSAAASPLKHIMKPKKMFKHSGWGRSSSSSSLSSVSSRGSFSSNSS